MSYDPDAGYRCPKCGGTSALVMPEPVPHSDVALKCLQCADVRRFPREALEGPSGGLDSTPPLD